MFDEGRKKPLPFWPCVIGIVTSPTGAVIRDMLHGFAERCPVRVIVWPARVQGETCAAEVAAAIRGFNALEADAPIPRPDLLIVARGGGSLEDLWGFNEEEPVLAAAESVIPLISAVGHETDWTLMDLAADARAPTPTKAAEWAVPKHSDLTLRLSECLNRARRCMKRHLERVRAEFRGAERGFPRPQTLVLPNRQRMDTAGGRLSQCLRHFALRSRGRYERTAVRLAPRLIASPCAERQKALHRTRASLVTALDNGLTQKRDRFAERSIRLNPSFLASPLSRLKERLTMAKERATRAVMNISQRKRVSLSAADQLLTSLSHKSVLARGYALVRAERGHLVHEAAKAALELGLDIEFHDGHVRTMVDRPVRSRFFSSPRPKKGAVLGRGIGIKKDDGGQGSLL